MGRPSKLTPELQARIVQAINGGNFRCVAAEWAGVSAKSMRAWMAKGAKERSGVHKEFRAAILEAERAAEIRMVALVMKAAADDPKHAEWWLERKCHERWGRKDRKEITGAKGGPLKVEAVRGMIEDPDIIALMRARREWKPEAAPTEPPTDGNAEQG